MQNHWHFLYYFLISFVPSFFPDAFYATVKTIPLLYGAPSYKSGHHVLRLAHTPYFEEVGESTFGVGSSLHIKLHFQFSSVQEGVQEGGTRAAYLCLLFRGARHLCLCGTAVFKHGTICAIAKACSASAK